MEQDHDFHGAEKRRGKRQRVLLTAKIVTAGGDIEARLRNLSQYGALLQCESPPPLGADVTFRRGDTVAGGHVIWVDDGRFGVEFYQPIEESEVLIHVAPMKPAPPPQPEPSPPGARAGFYSHALTPEERAIAEEWFRGSGRD